MTVKLEVDTKQLVNSMYDLSEGLQELTKPTVLSQVARSIFSLTAERFMIDVDNYARRNPKRMHHVYEWGGIGNPTQRLFVLERSRIIYGDLVISSNFLSSKMPVPINPELLKPGRTGKIVSSRSIFRNKAEVMESGTPVSFQAKRVLAFMGNNGIAFIAPGTQINILHPGGIQTKNAFAEYMLDWYTNKSNVVIDSSGYYDRLANDVSIALSSNKSSAAVVKNAVTKLANEIDTGDIVR